MSACPRRQCCCCQTCSDLLWLWEFPVSDSRTPTPALAFLGLGAQAPRLSAGEEEHRMPAPESQPLWGPSISALGSTGSQLSLSAPVSQTQLLGSSSVAKRKQISKHTSACPAFLPHPLMAADPGSPRTPLPLAIPAKLKPSVEAQGELQEGVRGTGQCSGGSGGGPHSHACPGAVPSGWRRNRRQIRAAAASSARRRNLGVAGERGLTPENQRG